MFICSVSLPFLELCFTSDYRREGRGEDGIRNLGRGVITVVSEAGE